MSLLLFDLGNSRLKFAPLRDDHIGESVAIPHDGERLPARWDAMLPTGFESAVVASVAAPPLLAQLLEGLTTRCARISIARCTSTFDDLRLAYPEPRTLGVDRFLAMLGARARGAQPWLVVGIGTALTLDLIDGQGRHRGGKIAPSPALMRSALHLRAAQLPETGGVFTAFADNTSDALRSGCDGAAVALIERTSHDAGILLGAAPRLIFHGGGVDALEEALPDDKIRAPALVLEGLAVWARISR